MRLWLALAEDYDPAAEEAQDQDVKERFLIARAAMGTLAVAASDEQVAQALCEEDCVKSLRHVINTQNTELVHRALVMALQLLSHGNQSIAKHLMEGSLVPCIAVVATLNDHQLGSLAKEVAEALAAAVDMLDHTTSS